MEQQKWLVKTAGRIIGPYSGVELANKLRKRELSFLDEVKASDTRWIFFREVQAFKEVIEEVRNAEVNYSEQTQSTFTLTSKTSSSITIDTDPGMATQVDIPVPHQSKDKNNNSAVISTSSYGTLSDRRVKKALGVDKYKKTIFFYAVAVLLMIVAFFFLRPTSKGYSKKQLLEFAQYSDELVRVGRYQEALDLLLRDEKNVYLSLDQVLLKVKLLLQLSPTTVDARRIFDTIGKISDEHSKWQYQQVKGLLLLKEKKWNEAEQVYQGLLGNKFGDLDAKMNLLVLKTLSGNFSGGLQAVAQVGTKTPYDPYVRYLKGMLYLIAPKEVNTSFVNSVVDEIQQESAVGREHRFESLLINAALLARLGKKDELATRIDKLLSVSPFETKNYVRHLSIDYSPLHWDFLGETCDLIVSLLGERPNAYALKSECKFLQGQEGSALSLVEQARKQYSTDVPLAATHSLLLFQIGRKAEAKSILNFLKSDTNYIAQLTLGEICISENEWSCVEKQFQSMRNADPKDPAVFAGLGLLAKNRGQYDMVREQVAFGLRIAPRYRPLMELKGDGHGM